MTDKMTCEEFWQKAMASDGGMRDAAMQRHLETCAECQAEMKVLTLLEATRREPSQAQLEALERRVGKACEARRTQSFDWHAGLWVPLAAAAACGALVFLGIWAANVPPPADGIAMDAGAQIFVSGPPAPMGKPASVMAHTRRAAESQPPGWLGDDGVAEGFFSMDEDESRLPGNSMTHSMAQCEEFFDLGG